MNDIKEKVKELNYAKQKKDMCANDILILQHRMNASSVGGGIRAEKKMEKLQRDLKIYNAVIKVLMQAIEDSND